MRAIATILLAVLWGQFVPTVPATKTSGGGNTVTYGSTTQIDVDYGNSGVAFATPIYTGTNASGYSSPTINYWVGSPVSASFDLGLYADSSLAPGSRICHASTGTITPSSGVNSLAISGCGTLTANTTYWIGYLVNNDTIQQGIASTFKCYTTVPGYIGTVYNAGSFSSLPTPFGTGTPTGSGCYSFSVTVTVLP